MNNRRRMKIKAAKLSSWKRLRKQFRSIAAIVGQNIKRVLYAAKVVLQLGFKVDFLKNTNEN